MEEHTIRIEFSKLVIKAEINLSEVLSFDALQYFICIHSHTFVTFLTHLLEFFFLGAHLLLRLLGLVNSHLIIILQSIFQVRNAAPKNHETSLIDITVKLFK